MAEKRKKQPDDDDEQPSLKSSKEDEGQQPQDEETPPSKAAEQSSAQKRGRGHSPGSTSSTQKKEGASKAPRPKKEKIEEDVRDSCSKEDGQQDSKVEVDAPKKGRSLKTQKQSRQGRRSATLPNKIINTKK